MIKANDTIFHAYLAMMDYFEEYLSKKYPNCSSVEDTKYYQTSIIKKIVRMFHSLELLTKNTLYEVSTRCVLRGILDSVTTYCFIYQRAEIEESMFRHYLYALDGWRVFDKSVLVIAEKNECNEEKIHCNLVIDQIKEKLYRHPFYSHDTSDVKKIIQYARWNYESLQNPRSLKYTEMYSLVGFNSSLIEYFQHYLAQFAHGLYFSNKSTNSEILKSVMNESIIIADKFIQTILQTFHDKEIVNHFLCSDIIRKFHESKDINFDDLAKFARALVRNDDNLLV